MSAEHYTPIQDLVSALPSGDGVVGLDLEADSLYRYSERICLIQVCYADEVKLVDPLDGESMSPLVDWLQDARIWMHGADYDMSLMLREWQMVPPFLYDTQIAAQLLGYQRFGYAGLVEQCFGVELSKSSQKADWGRRPLSDRMLEYACDDVRYLLPLAARLEECLKEKGRYEWFLQSCEAARLRVINREAEEKELWRIGGCGRLKPAGLRYLRSLWHWRDREAETWNRPSFMVATNKELIAWSLDLAESRRPDLRKKMRPDRRKRLDEAIEEAASLPEAEWPERPKRERTRKDPTFEGRLKVELEKRQKIGRELEIDPSLIASRAVLEQLVGGRGTSAELLLPWQRALLEI
jgi:ribonuclease D